MMVRNQPTNLSTSWPVDVPAMRVVYVDMMVGQRQPPRKLVVEHPAKRIDYAECSGYEILRV